MSSIPTDSADVLIVGGGIAGASAAHAFSTFASVLLLEREPFCGYHTTGRSAASYTENYGNATIRRLVLGSRSFLRDPPKGFAEHPLLTPCGMITIARADQLQLLEEELVRARVFVPSIAPMDTRDAIERVPILRSDYLAAAIYEPDSMEIDVHALHQGYLRAAKQHGARVMQGAEVARIERRGGRWEVHTPTARYSSTLIVDAAGAWADELARMAGIAPLGLQPKRRTAFNVAPPAGIEIKGWPMINDVAEELYFKPSAGQLLVSPSDATPWHACDVQPDEEDIAIGVDRLERATTLEVRRIERRWAGLRTFAADHSPVVGPDAACADFIWYAAQGGYGIKTSPALARACTDLVRHGRLPADLQRLGLETDDLSPRRFSSTSTSGDLP